MNTMILLESFTEVKSCKCGAEKNLYIRMFPLGKALHGYFVCCPDCYLSGPVENQPLSAISAWNRKTQARSHL